MIDVMMFLLVFFVLISINVLPALGLKINPPTSSRSEKVVERKRLMLSIDRDGNMFLDGQPTGLDAMEGRLKAAQETARAADEQLVVVIAGDSDAALQHVVDALEAMKSAGITGSAIITKPK